MENTGEGGRRCGKERMQMKNEGDVEREEHK
jgi:hypothetical protein